MWSEIVSKENFLTFVKFRYSEKATKFLKKIPPHFFDFTKYNANYDGKFVSNFVAFSEYLYFISAHLFFHKTFFLQYTLVEIKKFLFNIQLNAHLEKKSTQYLLLWGCYCAQISSFDLDTCLVSLTDYGRPMKPFFIEIQNFWAWADKLALGT